MDLRAKPAVCLSALSEASQTLKGTHFIDICGTWYLCGSGRVLAEGPNCNWHHKELSCWIFPYWLTGCFWQKTIFNWKEKSIWALTLTQNVSEKSKTLHRETKNELQSYITLHFIKWNGNINALNYTARVKWTHYHWFTECRDHSCLKTKHTTSLSDVYFLQRWVQQLRKN